MDGKGYIDKADRVIPGSATLTTTDLNEIDYQIAKGRVLFHFAVLDDGEPVNLTQLLGELKDGVWEFKIGYFRTLEDTCTYGYNAKFSPEVVRDKIIETVARLKAAYSEATGFDGPPVSLN